MTQGFKSTEFWVTLVAIAAGVYLLREGATMEQIVAIVAPAGTYSLSRGIAKKGNGGK